eukprot:GHVQ01006194.1.p1 GENE.GHVQ01006194.1~~GHVQ01006194.1.p1  ORF type:complete len:397 (-),score=86.68 GHVQ01006194.1:390-1412(-)
MQDRFSELRALAQQRSPAAAAGMASIDEGIPAGGGGGRGKGTVRFDNSSGAGGGVDIELGEESREGETNGEFMKEYFSKVKVLKSAISEAEKHVGRMRELKQSVLEATSPEQEKDISHELNHLLDTTNIIIAKTKKALHVIKHENVAFANKHTDSSEARIRTNMHQALTRRFGAVLTEYQTVQTEYKLEVRNKVARQVQIVYPEANEEEVHQMVEAGDMSSAMALRTRITGSHQTLKNALADIQDKYRDIRRLEQSVSELHQMFLEIATLVEHQGELLDQIEFSVTQAKEYTEKAETELVTARKYQETAKKRMCWITVCLIILGIIIALPIIITYTAKAI